MQPVSTTKSQPSVCVYVCESLRLCASVCMCLGFPISALRVPHRSLRDPRVDESPEYHLLECGALG